MVALIYLYPPVYFSEVTFIYQVTDFSYSKDE